MKQYYCVIGLGKTGLACVKALISRGVSVLIVDDDPKPKFLEEVSDLESFEFFHQRISASREREVVQVIVSPGVPFSHPQIRSFQSLNIDCVGDVEFFLREVSSPVAAITGSNGKSTVTALLGEMARYAQIKVAVGGNLGTPVLALDPKAELYILELSSFQLESINSLHASVATVLNVTQDHLDRYPNFESYVKAKRRIYHHAEFVVSNRFDPNTQIDKRVAQISFGLDEPHDDEWGVHDNTLVKGEQAIFSCEDLKIKGQHNWENVLAACAMATQLKIPLEAQRQALRSFAGLPYRSQWVRTVKGVEWINDSKATNVGSAMAAINGLADQYQAKVIWLAGGLDKGADFQEILPVVKNHVRHGIFSR